MSRSIFIKLFEFYSRSAGYGFEKELADAGRGQLLSVLKDRSASDPAGFVPFFEKIIVSDDIPNDYAMPILEGIVCHLLFRAGKLARPDEWDPKVPLADMVALARIVLDWLDQHPFLWERASKIADVLNLCAGLLETPEDAEVLIFCQYQLASHDDPEETENEEILTKADLGHISCCSVRGKIAESVILLASNLMKRAQPVHPLLPPLLFRFATDPHPGVRVSILRHLSCLAQYDPELAWKLCRTAFQPSHPKLWAFAETFLCDQSDKNFSHVRRCLVQIRNKAFDTAAKTWGKVSTLAYLSGHVHEKQLFDDLASLNHGDAWQGAVDAFETKITQSDNMDMILLTAHRFIPLVSKVKAICPLEWFYAWLSDLSEAAPVSAIQIYESLLSHIKSPELTSKVLELRRCL